MLSPVEPSSTLRVALVAGCLGHGGAEKQLVYMARALRELGAEVRVYSLTRGETYETELQARGIPVVWFGRWGWPPIRTIALLCALASFRPHVVQAGHFFVNLYVRLVAPLVGAVEIGTLRNDVDHEMEANGRWGRWLLHAPRGLLVNSQAAARKAELLGVDPARIRVLANAIDLGELGGTPAGRMDRPPGGGTVVTMISRLVTQKRIDRFLRAVALARSQDPSIRGLIVGDGPERQRLSELARSLSLAPDAVEFLGLRDDIPVVLARSDIVLHTSDHEGTPNALLESMAAGLPIVTTPAGDAGLLVEDGITGFVVPFDGVEEMSRQLVSLAASGSLRARLGVAGRARVEQLYGYTGLGERLVSTYRALAGLQRSSARVARALFPALES